MSTTAVPTADLPVSDTVFRPGELVTCRDREWVVQNGSTETVLKLRPVAGADDDVTTVLPALEDVQAASFDPPTMDDLGPPDDVRLLEQAFRISNLDPAGPFRGFGRMAVRPRPYQLVPLLMALRQLGQPATDGAYDAVRLLISDDVGIGKTIESLLVANELLTTGEADGLSVICPPHLADQWVDELRTKFHLDAVKVVPSTVKKLERDLSAGESLFQRHPITVASLDWVKSKKRRDEFAQEAPNCVIVDEAHLCARDSAKTGKHLRHELLTRLASERLRHLLLVTATPHSGKDGAFLSLVGLLHPLLAKIDVEEEFDADDRARLARHFVARKRVDVAQYQGDDDQVAFPTRLSPVVDGDATTYRWTPNAELSSLITEIIDWSKPRLSTENTDARDRRVWWWSILGLGRALGSSPQAAAASLRSRAGLADVATTADDPDMAAAEVDEVGRQLVADSDADELDDFDDTVTGSKVADDPEMAAAFARFAERADDLCGYDTDPKARLAVAAAEDLIGRGVSPIFFCEFIETAEYLAELLGERLDGVAVRAVTGNTPADVRASDVAELAANDKRVLVATKCLSEGINLQRSFDAVLHYDLPWSPTRLEQREGRVDRYGQPKDTVYVTTFEGAEPTLDGFIQTHLIDKHNRIKQRLGFSIPVPGVTDDIIDAAASVWFGNTEQQTLDLGSVGERWEEAAADQVQQVDWVEAEADTRTRAKYAQRTIDPTEVAAQAAAVSAEIGTPGDVARFVTRALAQLGATHTGPVDSAATPNDSATVTVSFGDTSDAHVHHTLAATLGVPPEDCKTLDLRFAEPDPPRRSGRHGLLLSRTHPFVTDLARLIVDPAMDRHVDDAHSSRLGVVTTDAVDQQTMLVTCRFRFDVDTTVRRKVRTGPDAGTYVTESDTHLVEQVVTVPVVRRPGTTDYTVDDTVHPDRVVPTSNTPGPDAARAAERAAGTVADGTLRSVLTDHALVLGERLETQHAEARGAFSEGGLGRADVHPHDTVDVLSVLVARPDRTATSGADL